MRRCCSFLAIALLLLAGCGAPDPGRPAASGAPTSAPSVTGPAEPAAEALAQRCENARERYALRYPAQWFVAQDDDVEPCTFFDSTPIVLEQDSEATGVAIRVDVREGVLLARARQDALAEGDMRAEPRDLGEWRAVRVTGTLTEEFLLPAGTKVTTWLVELDGRTLVLTADDHGADDYAGAVLVLDEMVRSLEVI